MAGPPPVLVTGMPRSGTTWVARQLAQAQWTSLPGREPMNPRGSQHALGGTLTSWTRLERASGRQRLLLRLAYSGLDPRIFSKYGYRQWAAALPWVRVIVKDPFAVISLPAVVEATGALPVVVYRHPGAVLASFRRMQWTPDPDEVTYLESKISGHVRRTEASVCASEDVELIARMWSTLYSLFLLDAERLSELVVVDHGDLARGGQRAMDAVRKECGLRPARRQQRSKTSSPAGMAELRGLHNFNRNPQEVASTWRTKISSDDVAYLEEVVGPVWTALQERRLRLEPADDKPRDVST